MADVFKDGLQFAWDSTSIKLAETCHYKYYLKMIEGWQPRRKSVHLLFGGWYATALEHYYKYRAGGNTSNRALCQVVLEALVATWIIPKCDVCHGRGSIETANIDWIGKDCDKCSGTGKLKDQGAPWVSDHPTKTRENLIRTIIWYVDQFENEAIEVVRLSDGRPAVEYSFALPVDNDIVFCGHIDRLVTYAGSYYISDQKTTGGTIGSYYFEGFTPDTQVSMYVFAGKMIYDLPVSGMIIDAAQIAVGFTRFERGYAFRSEGQLTEWYHNTLGHIAEIQEATRKGVFKQRDTSCGLYGGCEFRNICSRSPEVRGKFLEGDFERGPIWDPLKSRA